jgi:hypothetical protein
MEDDKAITTDAISEEVWIAEPSEAFPQHIHEAARHGVLPPELLHLKVRVSIREWPEDHEKHLMVNLGESLLALMREGGTKLGMPVLPPGAEIDPLDALRFLRKSGQWSDAILDLSEPLWLAIVHGDSRHFGIEYKLVIQINTKWGVSPFSNPTPKQLLEAFGFNPAEYSLYFANSSESLPPDVPLNLKRGDRFEAQKDGRYGAPCTQELRALDRECTALAGAGCEVRTLSQGGQEYVEVSNVEVPSPPWCGGKVRVLIAVPATYPAGGLDAFYLDRSSVSHQGGAIPYEQARATIDGRQWGLISWHYPVNRPWNPNSDNIASHIAHCRGYFLRRGVRQ